MTVKFSDGTEKTYTAEAATNDTGLFVLHKRNRVGKLETAETFRAEAVIMALFPDGRIVNGGRTINAAQSVRKADALK